MSDAVTIWDHAIRPALDYWQRVLPDDVAYEQAWWDRRHRIFRAYEACATRAERAAVTASASRMLGVSTARVWQLSRKAERERRQRRRSPAERYLAQPAWQSQ
jgi:hypothetical protein